MKLILDESKLVDELRPRLDDPRFRAGLAGLTSDSFFVAFFLASVSQGEALGESAVALIGQEELASRISDLKKQEEEERGHKERTFVTAQSLFPQFFDSTGYRYPGALEGEAYYRDVLETNRRRLKERNCYSRLNLYLTTTFGYEIMVLLLYSTVADAVRNSHLGGYAREQVANLLEEILSEEETHVGVVDQHNALLHGSREGLSKEACDLLETLACMTVDEYRSVAEYSVDHVIELTARFADTEAFRREIEAGAIHLRETA